MSLFITDIHRQVLALLGGEGILIDDEERAVLSLEGCSARTKCLRAYYEIKNEVKNLFLPMPMEIIGVKLYAVRRGDYIYKYCNDFNSAIDYCKELNEG